MFKASTCICLVMLVDAVGLHAMSIGLFFCSRNDPVPNNNNYPIGEREGGKGGGLEMRNGYSVVYFRPL